MTSWQIYGEPTRGRSCGTCKICCTLVPVELHDGHKPAGTRCKHLCSKGCGIYANRPRPCRYWSCKWLFDPATAAMRRPDQTGYIVDPSLDTVLVNGEPVEAIQVWCDPARPDAHRDPALRAYIDANEMIVIIRYSSTSGITLIPPSIAEDREWHEFTDASILSEEAMHQRLAEAQRKAPAPPSEEAGAAARR